MIAILFFPLDLQACTCSRSWNDSFSKTVEESEFVALVKVISFDSYLEDLYPEMVGTDNTMKTPNSMTVEIIKKYKGQENRKRIRVFWGNGILCKPSLTKFRINGYYLISPNPLNNSIDTEYDFSSCRTEYLNVDMDWNKAYGKYSVIRYIIDIDSFEDKLQNGDQDLVMVISIGSILILTLLVVKRNKIRNANN